MNNRRKFIKTTLTGAAAVSFGGVLPGFSSKSYARILGSDDRIRVGVMGVNSRGLALASNFARQKNCEVVYISDVDTRAADKCIKRVGEIQDSFPKSAPDFRKILDEKHVDALVIAAPDHWHAPAALMALKADKHVYLEKPCSHSPSEGEILIKAVDRYKRVLQIGNQRRSWPIVVEAINELKAGVIGRPYLGKSWYANTREPIGIGKEAPVPEWLNWELWQGPAPRKHFRDNIVHYNWHWFWHWGTGEALNNGTHMVDILHWGLGVDFPMRVSSNGGRFHYQDDWETPDTQIISMDFKEGVSLSWEGRSCNGKNVEGSSVGAIFYGETGSLLIGGGNQYTIFDQKNNVVKQVNDQTRVDARDKVNPSQSLDELHIINFFDAIKLGTPLKSDIESGHKSTLLVQLGNIAQRMGRSLDINTVNGHILNDKEAMKIWSRDYEKGWEMKL